MQIAGAFMVFMLVCGGFALAQAIFYQHTGRAFWRAMMPSVLRYTILPDDKVELDSFMVLEEWVAIVFLGSMSMLPLIALNTMGFISFLC